MTLFLDLNCDQISVDVALLQRVPYELIVYYLALPLAQENGRVSVVMAHPENTAAIDTLQRLLQAEIVPVQARSQAIQAALQRIYPTLPPPPPQPTIIAWSHTPQQETAVFATAALLRQAYHAEMEMLPVNGHKPDEVLSLALSRQHTMAVLDAPPTAQLPDLFARLNTPFVLVRGAYRPLRRILVALRGFSSDIQAVDWILPLAQAPDTAVTLLPLADSPLHQARRAAHHGDLVEPHLELCLAQLRHANIPIHLKFRQEQPIHQIINELNQGDYDLLVVTAEAQGDYVQTVLAAMAECQAHAGRPIFILKPPQPV
ncbi:MAG: universal stress protein [Anaerolineae bacterium]|nr:universal stress protein [Anaerolineae bacterium]